MEKYNYIKRQIAKTNKKNDENYIVTRTWHLLDNYNIKMDTQQYIARDNPEFPYALADMYFPQFNIVVEVDEAYHQNSLVMELDEIRKNDIINAIGCKIYRIDATASIQKIHNQIDEVVSDIKNRILTEELTPWDLTREYSPNSYVEKGYIDVDDNVHLRTVADCCNCFGAGYKGFQGSGASHKFEKDTDIKRLKFYPNGAWDNVLEADESRFIEFHTDHNENESYLQKRLTILNQKIALFTHAKTASGQFEATFKGLYKVNKEDSTESGKVTYDRISKIMPTYYPQNTIKPHKIAEAYDSTGYKVAHFYNEKTLSEFRYRHAGGQYSYTF